MFNRNLILSSSEKLKMYLKWKVSTFRDARAHSAYAYAICACTCARARARACLICHVIDRSSTSHRATLRHFFCKSTPYLVRCCGGSGLVSETFMVWSDPVMTTSGSLPTLSSKDEDMKGPISTSNWAIKGKLIAGAYPGSPHPDKHATTIKSVVTAGELILLLVNIVQPELESSYYLLLKLAYLVFRCYVWFSHSTSNEIPRKVLDIIILLLSLSTAYRGLFAYALMDTALFINQV